MATHVQVLDFPWVRIFLLNINAFKIDDNKLDVIVSKRCTVPKGVNQASIWPSYGSNTDLPIVGLKATLTKKYQMFQRKLYRSF